MALNKKQCEAISTAMDEFFDSLIYHGTEMANFTEEDLTVAYSVYAEIAETTEWNLEEILEEKEKHESHS